MFCGFGSSLEVQSPGVKSPTSGIQAQPLTLGPVFHRTHNTGLLLIVVHRLVTAVASLIAEHRFVIAVASLFAEHRL